MADTHVLINGGSRGIGAAMVEAFAGRGCKVSFTYRTSIEAARELEERFGAFAICADSASEADVDRACDLACARFGRVDVLINCAGVSVYGLLQDVTVAEWDSLMAVNLRSAFLYTRRLLPAMIGQKAGCILNVSSIWGMVGASMEVLYSTSKAALIGMTKALAKEVGPSGIRVNCIAPGVIETDMLASLGQETLDALAEETPLGRLGTPADVASLAVYLCLDDRFMTGQILSPNGGLVIS